MVTIMILFGVLVFVLLVARIVQTASTGQTRRRWFDGTGGPGGWDGFDGGGHHHGGGHHGWGGHDGGGGHGGGFDGGGGGGGHSG